MKRLVFIPSLAAVFFLILVVLARAADQPEQITTPDTSGKIYSLSECVSIALEKDPQVLYSQANIIQNQYSLKSSKKDLYPSLLFNYGYQYSPDAYEPLSIKDTLA